MNYIEYTSKNLKEYYKILDTISSSTNPEQFEVAKNMASQFAKNCDFRQSKLKKLAWIKTFKFSMKGWDDYYSYKKTTTEQIESIISIYNLWLDQYNEWVELQRLEEEQRENDKRKKILITGFEGLFKKNKRKRK
jgi:hypothetical protein